LIFDRGVPGCPGQLRDGVSAAEWGCNHGGLIETLNWHRYIKGLLPQGHQHLSKVAKEDLGYSRVERWTNGILTLKSAGRIAGSTAIATQPLSRGTKIMQWAAIVLAVAAVGGATLATIRLRGGLRPPTWMALGHGAVAATGLVLLIYAAVTTGLPPLAYLALGLFVLAAAGGATLFVGFHLREKALPIPFVIGHGLLAVTAFVLLVAAILRS